MQLGPVTREMIVHELLYHDSLRKYISEMKRSMK